MAQSLLGDNFASSNQVSIQAVRFQTVPNVGGGSSKSTLPDAKQIPASTLPTSPNVPANQMEGQPCRSERINGVYDSDGNCVPSALSTNKKTLPTEKQIPANSTGSKVGESCSLYDALGNITGPGTLNNNLLCE
jgi:hypothetical protein